MTHAYRLLLASAPLVLLALVALVRTAPAAEESEYGVLHEATGVEETFIYCTACHSERIVAQQGLTREDWDEMLVWMVDEQGMPEIDPPDRELVLDYLAIHYGPDRPNFPTAAN